MLTPSLLLQAFQFPSSLKGLDSEQKRQPDAGSTTTRKRLLPNRTANLQSRYRKMKEQRLTFKTQHVRENRCEATQGGKNPPLLLKGHVQIRILSAPVFAISVSIFSSVQTSQSVVSTSQLDSNGELCLQLRGQNDAYENQDLLKSHYLVIPSTGKCLGRTESALKLCMSWWITGTVQRASVLEVIFMFWSLCTLKKNISSLVIYVCLSGMKG